MTALDMSHIPPNNVPVLIAQAPKAYGKLIPPVVFCWDVDNFSIGEPLPGRELESVSANNVITPLIRGEFYKRTGIKLRNVTTVSLLQQPKHGKLYPEPTYPASWGYISDQGYKGHDRAVFLVEGKGKRVRVVFNLLVGVTDDKNPAHCRDEKFEPINKSEPLELEQKPES